MFDSVLNVKGQGCGKVDRHLPTQYRRFKRGMTAGSWHMRRAGLICSHSSGSSSHIMATALVLPSARFGLHQKAAFFNAIVMEGASRGAPEEDKARFSLGYAVNLYSLFHSIHSLTSGLISDLWLLDVNSVIPKASQDLLGKNNPVLGSVLLAERLQFVLWFLSRVSSCCFEVFVSSIHSLYSLVYGLISDLRLFAAGSVIPEASRDLLGRDNLVLSILLTERLQFFL